MLPKFTRCFATPGRYFVFNCIIVNAEYLEGTYAMYCNVHNPFTLSEVHSLLELIRLILGTHNAEIDDPYSPQLLEFV